MGMKKKDLCVWYNESSGVERVYGLGFVYRKWVENTLGKAENAVSEIGRFRLCYDLNNRALGGMS